MNNRTVTLEVDRILRMAERILEQCGPLETRVGALEEENRNLRARVDSLEGRGVEHRVDDRSLPSDPVEGEPKVLSRGSFVRPADLDSIKLPSGTKRLLDAMSRGESGSHAWYTINLGVLVSDCDDRFHALSLRLLIQYGLADVYVGRGEESPPEETYDLTPDGWKVSGVPMPSTSPAAINERRNRAKGVTR